MGASFRRVEQIIDLAGCDLLTISPDLLDALQKAPGEITPKLTLEGAQRVGGREDHARREDLSLDAQPGCDGRREAVRRHPPLLRRRPQARAVGGHRSRHGVTDRRSTCRPIRRCAAWPTGRRSSSCCDRSAAPSAARRWPMSPPPSDAIDDAGANVAFVHGAIADRSRAVVREVRSRRRADGQRSGAARTTARSVWAAPALQRAGRSRRSGRAARCARCRTASAPRRRR